MDELQRRKRREEAQRRVRRQRRITALVVLAAFVAVVVLVAGAFSSGGSDRSSQPASQADRPAKPTPPPELPRGGRRIFPRNRIVAFYGAPQDDALGALGIGSPAKMAARLRKQARPYRRGRRPVLPAFELIAAVASGAPGDDGSYSFRQPKAVIDRYLAA